MGDMTIKLVMLFLFFAVMVGIGLYCRRHASDVTGFVLGGRSVFPEVLRELPIRLMTFVGGKLNKEERLSGIVPCLPPGLDQ